ncbi:helix-turn-helix transcriptional regulator [Actinoplanes sp. L3-i22]|uniref:helix-turn-helix domain-containing protein n=1 Tax=Actinoplanes sp. L3-i22 TaxID=2836373 RepID=UPI001C765465|nr:helix-turn-helix transcriptional regulator [Actinoplanes sp. L3-i22]BCY13053.1 hypothetical protein L3i22_081410 [Actinoplanes sp. L3-i22]
MTAHSGAPGGQDESVGTILGRMRRSRKINGSTLGAMVGMSQPKISRIEREDGGPPAPADVVAIARALEADEATIDDLRRRAEQAHDRMTEWRPAAAGLANRQRGVAEWEFSAKEIRDFQPAVLPGLVQTGSYMRATLMSFQRVVQSDGDERELSRAITARTERQEVIADTGITFRIVITEAVLRTRICPPASMIEQLSHLRELAHRPNVRFAVVPEEVPTPIPPQLGFTIFDEDMVVIETYNTGLFSRGGNVVRQYGRVFEGFEQAATTDIEPILARYEAYYVEKLTRPA